MPRWSTTSAIVTTCLIFMVVFVSAECPNGCSGNGDCMAKDMCNCYKNYQGNDCADRTCLFGRAHMDTPKGDINMDKSRSTAGWILQDSQQHPAMTFEYFSPAALNDEAHFQMECSNKGICDRSTGLCQCFDGYEGAGCRRTTCPGKCSGHGTCESIRELGLKAGGTLFGLKQPAGAVKYDLWDSNSTYGCRCDPWYHGPDCSRRNCKVGVDPLYMSVGTPNYETFVVHAYVASTYSLTGAWIRLRVFDYYGESYITTKITVTNVDADGAAAVAAAIKGVPNLTFNKITCEAMGAGSNLSGYTSKRPTGTLGFSVVCQYIDNPGKMRLPEIAASNVVTTKFVATLAQQGRDEEWFTIQTVITATSVDATGLTLTNAGATTLTGTTTLVAGTQTLTAPVFVKIGPHIVLVTAMPLLTTMTLAYPLKHTLGTSPPLFVADPSLITSITAGPAVTVDVAVGDTTLKVGSDPSTAHPVGSILYFYNAFYTVLNTYADPVTANTWNIQLDKPFGGSTFDGDKVTAAATVIAYNVVLATDWKTRVYRYVSECSGRGMCGYDTGICTCFKGYTNDNCNTQNILAL